MNMPPRATLLDLARHVDAARRHVMHDDPDEDSFARALELLNHVPSRLVETTQADALLAEYLLDEVANARDAITRGTPSKARLALKRTAEKTRMILRAHKQLNRPEVNLG